MSIREEELFHKAFLIATYLPLLAARRYASTSIVYRTHLLLIVMCACSALLFAYNSSNHQLSLPTPAECSLILSVVVDHLFPTGPSCGGSISTTTRITNTISAIGLGPNQPSIAILQSLAVLQAGMPWKLHFPCPIGWQDS